jgi:8-oxo-dGTP pyrophosphatase MutT (NUDIX family)
MPDESRPARGPRHGRHARRARVETSSGGVVYRCAADVEFLLIRDPYDNWGLPKGHIEGGETPQQAALREVEEETGLRGLELVAQLPTIDWYFRARGKLVHKFCHFFLLRCADGDPVPQLDEGITECMWSAPPNAVDIVSYANARDVLRAAVEVLGADAAPVMSDAAAPGAGART